jgi:hypothetical protein
MGLADLPTLGEVNAQRRAPQKGLPPVLERKARKEAKADKADVFRAAIWARDKGCSRATGKPLVKSGTTDWSALGEVDHAYPRSTAPDRIYDVSNGILLSKEENRLRKVPCPRAPEFKLFDYEGPDDRSKPQTFIWRNADGKVTKRRKG